MYDEITRLRTEADKVSMIFEKYPDSYVFRDLYNNVYYCSASINLQTDHFEICTLNKHLIFNAWIEIKWRGEIVRIYAHSPQFKIGEIKETGEHIIYNDVLAYLQNHNFPGKALTFVRKYIEDEKNRLAKILQDKEEENDFTIDDTAAKWQNPIIDISKMKNVKYKKLPKFNIEKESKDG